MSPRYYILNPNAIPKGFVDNKKASELILSSIGLDNMEYRIGHSKVRQLYLYKWLHCCWQWRPGVESNWIHLLKYCTWVQFGNTVPWSYLLICIVKNSITKQRMKLLIWAAPWSNCNIYILFTCYVWIIMIQLYTRTGRGHFTSWVVLHLILLLYFISNAYLLLLKYISECRTFAFDFVNGPS